MYDIRQFKPTLYFLLLMGVTGFALASQSPGLWVIAAAGIGVNAWLVKSGRFAPMPRVLANAVTLMALAYVVVEVRSGGSTALLTIGEFLVLLHLVKLFEQRANRDYAQLLILSLLLMVAAAISTASLLFGILLVFYLFVSLYCCLLFHLKVETDAARAALKKPEEKINPATLRQDQRHLAGSMRRLTGLVSAVAIAMAVLVFLFFPRGAGEGIFGRRMLAADHVLTGFSDRVSFQQVARITRNEEIVAHVKVTKEGKPWGGMQPLLLRGMTLDAYTGDGSTLEGEMPPPGTHGRQVEPWQWVRSGGGGEVEVNALGGSVAEFAGVEDSAGTFTQEITLQPTGTRVLFAIAGAASMRSSRDLKGRYFARDAVLSADEPMEQTTPLQYTVVSTGILPVGDVLAQGRSRVDAKVAEYARRPEVSGTFNGRPMAALRGAPDAPADIDQRIAWSIEQHLKSQFKYTLDLTDARNLASGEDPMAAFLYDFKRGHCEYFAGAMTLMCQSLGLQARMVVGFRSDEFNSVGGFFIVRQSHAHAWVEVLTKDGWKTFDPTSGSEADVTRQAGLFGKIKGLFNFLEYKWGSSVVAYGTQERQNVVQAMDSAMTRTAVSGSQSLMGFEPMFNRIKEAIESAALITGLIGVMIAVMMVFVAWYLLEKARLRRRARRIGLANLPGGEKERLARQLGFYDDLLRLLERHRIARPKNLTPLEFSGTLSFLPHQVYDDVRRLTQLFYRIRYGKTELSPVLRKRLGNVIARLERLMQEPRTIREI